VGLLIHIFWEWGFFAWRFVADVSKAIQAIEDLLMVLESEGNTFVRNVGKALQPNKPDSCKSRGSYLREI
jgi:hypothetical protein